MDATATTENLVQGGSFWFPEGVSTFASNVDALGYFVHWISVICFIGIVGVAFYFTFKYRRSEKNPKAEKQITENHFIEITWTVLPLILVMIIFAWGFKDYLKMSVPPSDSMEIKVTGKKWFWQFDYPKDGVTTVGEIVVPINQPVKLTMSSEDVIHSFFIPNFRTKMDVVPNRYTTLWFEATKKGNYQVFCTEFCGDGHSNMLANLKVVSREEYKEWLESQGMGDDLPLLERGEKLYTKNACNTCHSVDGSKKTGPTWKGVFGSKEVMTDGKEITVDDNYLRESIMNPNKMIVKGYDPVMPTYKGLLKDKDVDALIEFIKAQK